MTRELAEKAESVLREDGEIRINLHILETNIEYLEKNLCTLFERIEPILSEDVPPLPEPEKDVVPGATSDIGKRIEKLASKVVGIQGLVNKRILPRLAI